VREALERWSIPTAAVEADPSERERWLAAMREAVGRLL